MKLTGWYSGDQKPVRVGVYQRDISTPNYRHPDIRYSYWDGRGWKWSCKTAKGARKRDLIYSGIVGVPWRGVMA